MKIKILIAVAALLLNLTLGEEQDSNESNVSVDIPETTTELLRTESRRVARQLNIPGQEYVIRGNAGNRQVIKIPGNAKIKVIPPQQPQQIPQQKPLRGRQPIQQQSQQQSQVYKPKYQTSPRPKRGPFHEVEEEEYYDDIDYSPNTKKNKRTKNGYMVRDVGPEEFYDTDDYELFQKKPKKKANKVESYSHRTPPKKYKSKYNKYGDAVPMGSDFLERPEKERRPHYDDETGYDFVKPVSRFRNQQTTATPPTSYYEDNHGYGYHDYASASSITMKQVPPPNLGPKDHHEKKKDSHSVKKQHALHNEQSERYQEQYHSEGAFKKIPSTRQIQSMFPQQYTTHNPHVTRNLGMDDNERSGYYHYEDKYGHDEHRDYRGMDDHQTSASEQRPNLVPTGSSGIHIVNPPQFNTREQVTPPPNSQRATIRDILRQDCPEAEKIGYCASPPRYPTQQINGIVKKCADILDAMYSAAPLETEDDLSSFSSRSDSGDDIEFIDTGNTTNSSSEIEANWSQWSRSSNDGSNTVCDSVLSQTEPGYAREVSSGRWFVIMQTMDHIVQRIMTDTCERPGKPCGGLAGLKCSRTSHLHHGFKATRCVQRYTQQRLVSWDPEVPHACPKVRIFRFPSACLCHLSVE